MSDSKRRLLAAVCALATIGFTAACKPAAPPPPATPAISANAWAVVDGHEITRDDVDKAYRRIPDASQTLSEEETLTAKLSLLDSIIVQELLLAKARALNITVADKDLDAAYAEAKKNISDETFQQELKARGLTPEDMRDGLRRELLTQKVIDQEVGSKVTVTDQEITSFYNVNRTQFNIAEESYHIAQIVVTPVREAQVTNNSGDDATTPQAASAKVQMLMERLKAGASFRDLAAGYSEDPESAPRGGDLGLVPVSRIKQAPQPLRDAILNKPDGSVNVAQGGGAYTLVLVVAHEQAGQRDLTMPAVHDGIKETLRGRKETLLRAAYLTTVRGDAKIVNVFAHKVVDSKGVVPAAK